MLYLTPNNKYYSIAQLNTMEHNIDYSTAPYNIHNIIHRK